MHPTSKNALLHDNGVCDKSSVAFYSLGYAFISYIIMIAIICTTHMLYCLCNRATLYYRCTVMKRKKTWKVIVHTKCYHIPWTENHSEMNRMLQ